MAGSIVGSVIGGKKLKKAASKAAAAIEEATNYAINEQRGARDYTTNAFGPLSTNLAGDYGAFRGDILGGEFDPRNYDFEADPGYQFRMDEGQRALERSAAARGNLLSGAQLKAATRYGQDYASNEYDRGYNRNANALAAVLGQRQGLVDYGVMGSQANANAWNNWANNAGQLKLAGTGAKNNALMAKANASANMWSGIASGITGGIGQLAGAFGGFGTGGGGGGFTGNLSNSTNAFGASGSLYNPNGSIALPY